MEMPDLHYVQTLPSLMFFFYLSVPIITSTDHGLNYPQEFKLSCATDPPFKGLHRNSILRKGIETDFALCLAEPQTLLFTSNECIYIFDSINLNFKSWSKKSISSVKKRGLPLKGACSRHERIWVCANERYAKRGATTARAAIFVSERTQHLRKATLPLGVNSRPHHGRGVRN